MRHQGRRERLFGLWHKDLHVPEEANDEDRGGQEMGDGLHEQKRSTLVDSGSSNRGGVCFQLHLAERVGDWSLIWQSRGIIEI
jgi:hypothetical protein